MFTRDKPVYLQELQGLPELFGRECNTHGITVRGYGEQGTATTPFDIMCSSTNWSRFDIAMWALERAPESGGHVSLPKPELGS
ncbi:putative phosphoketolase [Beauveria bassiana]|nr:putative phosphoketolase [Beauveria bassiana]KAH8721023.1 putative phosphoketolase [Beauveria bassiana]